MLSIVTSMYNEEDNVRPFLGELIEVVRAHNEVAIEIIAVDNGSTDNTARILDGYCEKYSQLIKTVHAPTPTLGKGNGVTLGIKNSKGNYIALLDADLEQDPRDIFILLKNLGKGKYDFLIGWRKKRKIPFERKIYSKFYNRLVKLMFGILVPDIGGQPRVFKSEILKNYKIASKRWAIEVELPYLAKQRGFKVGYLPVTHRPRKRGESKVKFTACFEILYDLIKFRLGGASGI